MAALKYYPAFWRFFYARGVSFFPKF